jgi:hypothetical protein
MDHDSNTTLEQFLARASSSALKSLDAVVDVEQRLRELFRDVGHDPRTPDCTERKTD